MTDKIARAYLQMQRPSKYSALETCFGSHSLEQLQEAIETRFAHDFGDPESDEINLLHANHSLDPHGNVGLIPVYTSNSYPINSALHEAYAGNHKNLAQPENLRLAQNLDSILGNRHAQHDFTVYTGLKHSPFKNIEPTEGGYMVHLPAYTSTSTNLMKAMGFTGFDMNTDHDPLLHGGEIKKNSPHILKINVPKGLNITSVRNLTRFPKEDEMLMHRGYDVSIHPAPTVVNWGGVPYHVWDTNVVRQRRLKLPESMSRLSLDRQKANVQSS